VTRAPRMVGVFGGTFDPIHLAHLAVAESARDHLGLERVLFIPNGEPPHKPDRTVTPARDRLAMVRAAVAGNPAFEVSTVEVDRDGPSYTADTLATMLAESGSAGPGRDGVAGGDEPDELALILSVEALAGLATWHDPGRVLRLSRLVVAPRDGYPDITEAAIASLVPGSAPRVTMLDGPRMRLSASEIRARVAAGRSIRYLVPDAVAAYIGDHGLYQAPRRIHRT
jgi:nicotinate-nucleotide adenylyltransferase